VQRVKLLSTSLLLIALLLLGTQNIWASQIDTPDAQIPPTFFGLHIHGTVVPRPGMPDPDPWPGVPFAAWRLWDAYVEWPKLQPQSSKWDFSKLDKYVELAAEHNVEILMPLGLTPAWASSRPEEKTFNTPGVAAPPKNLEDWKAFVRQVATRYKGKIHYYEIWNEPNLKGFFSGTPQEMVILVREASKILKQVDPSVKIVSPSPTSSDGPAWLDTFLQQGGGQYVDVIGYHFYVTPAAPEALMPLADKIHQIMQRNHVPQLPLWDTESGWRMANHQNEVKPLPSAPFNKVLSDEEAIAYVARFYTLAWVKGIARVYWYAWDNQFMGLTEADGRTTKPAAKAYAVVSDWLVGARMTSCNTDQPGIWNCQIARDGGYVGRILWSPSRTVDFSIPLSWHVREIRDLSGNHNDGAALSRVKIGPTPLLLDNVAP
jgi:hypothetical protein